MDENSLRVTIAGLERDLPVVTVSEGTRIAFLDVLGDLDLLDAAVRALLDAVPPGTEIILGGDTVGLVVAHHAAVVSGLPYVAARKKRTPVMRRPLTAVAQSVAADRPATFHLDDRAAARLRGRHVLVIDEVCSTGATLTALESLAGRAGAARTTKAAICTEGRRRTDVVHLAHLPVWVGSGSRHD